MATQFCGSLDRLSFSLLHCHEHLVRNNGLKGTDEVRPHQTLNYKTPQAFEDAYSSVLSENDV